MINFINLSQGIKIAPQIKLEAFMYLKPRIMLNHFLIVTLSVILLSISTFAENYSLSGGDNSGGGDPRCESRFKAIRDDFSQWLKKDGPRRRKLDLKKVPELNLTYETFEQLVSPVLVEGALIIKCVDPNPEFFDKQLPETQELIKKLTFHGANKLCIFEKFNSIDIEKQGGAIAQVICDQTQMRPVEKSEDVLAATQYEQVVHEALGVAGIESPKNSSHLEDSNYPISPQFRRFLAPVTELKLSFDEPEFETLDIKNFKNMSNTEKVDAAIDTFVNELCFRKPYNLFIDSFESLLHLKVDEYNFNLIKSCAKDVYYKTREYIENPIGPSADDKSEQGAIINFKLTQLNEFLYKLDLINAYKTRSRAW